MSFPSRAVLLALLWVSGASPLLADKVTPRVTLKAVPEGVLIDAGLAGQFTLEVPTLTKAADDYTGEKPAVAVQDPLHAVAAYPGGGKISIGLDGSRITYLLDGLPPSAFALRFTTLIPIAFGQGGKVALDAQPFVPLPAGKEKNFILQATATKLRVTGPLGEGYSLTTPPGGFGFHEVADNRFYNWPTFIHIFTYRLRDNPDKQSAVFEVLPEPLESAQNVEGARRFAADRYGQLAAKAFPGKVASDQELKDDIAKEKAFLDALPLPPAPRDPYGGLAGSGAKYKLAKTGFFHVGKAAGRDVLVTPDGNAFYQLAVDCISPDDHTLVTGRERAFEWIPPHEGEFAPAWLPANPNAFSFYTANWIRKFGTPFDAEAFSLQALTRLRKWGFNSAGCWSLQTEAMRAAKFPATPQLPLEVWMAPGLRKMEGIDRLCDPFAPGFEEAADKAFAAQVAPHASDPTIVGYFLGNEQLFENVAKLVPTQKSDSPSKLRLVELLREKYKGDIAAFNIAWAPKTPFGTFDALRDATLFPATPKAGADMEDFLRLFLETHYGTTERLFRKHDPNHLLLGSRWQPGTANSELLVRTAARHVDVVSVNYYTYAIQPEFLDRIHGWSEGKPMLLSEWSYGAPDQGLMGGGREVAGQKERGLAYRNYVETTAAILYVVGQQWFTYIDEASMGRWFEGFNGEAGNTGFYNVADRPYLECLAECKKANDAIYPVVFGEKAPFHFDDPRFEAKGKGGRKSLLIPRALPGMKLDGTSRNWPGIPPEALAAKDLSMGRPNPDFAASFRLCWDDKNLYVLAEVKDKTPLVNPFKDGDLWQGDGLELFLGSEKPESGGALLPGDRQILLGAAEKPLAFVANAPAQPVGIEVVTVRNPGGDGYAIEAAIPWAALAVAPSTNKEILFDLGVDNTDDGKLRAGQWLWNGTERNSSDRGAWGRARLVGGTTP